ncbi:MAG: sigma-54 dependent transcriptional regulator [Planctomycetota bacterium]|nr:sigma-54 dependent transcriptional regulator [Planctomycetota bacterium]
MSISSNNFSTKNAKSMAVSRILVVDDDALSREFLAEAAESLGLVVDAVDSGQAALDRLNAKDYDLVITDLRMPGMDGIELIQSMNVRHSEVPAVVITAHGTIESTVQAMRLGARDFMVKPVSPDSIRLVVERVAHTSRLERENAYLRKQVGGAGEPKVIARSREMLETLSSAQRLANSDGTVLITGESGTGKERVASFVHENSDRRDMPFIRVNCAALSEQLLESELFGHERGAFTGAIKRREGRFELANGGTLLLDEIGEISPALQSKLLRVLQEGEFERVGGNQTLSVDVRVLATTNRDLSVEVADDNFREDLYYRLHVLPLHLAPLRERTEDILPLAEHFARHYGQKCGRSAPSFSRDAREQLASWEWRGNVRELENVVQRAVLRLQGDEITSNDLVFGPSPKGCTDGSDPARTGIVHPGQMRQVLANRTISEVERETILGTLDSTRGNKTEAARRLGVTARTLSNKMKLWKQMGLVA